MTDEELNRRSAEPPANPFYRREYCCSLSHGNAWISINAPGNRLKPDDARDLIDWLWLIVKQLEREASVKALEKGE